MARKLPRSAAWVAWVLVLSVCSANPQVRTAPTEDAALIYGFYDMSDAPFELGCVRITQDERAGIAYRQSCMTTLKSGLFFLENAPPMKYHVPFFYAGGKLHTLSSDRADAFTVPARSLYYLGTFKYKVVNRSLGDIVKLTPEQYGLLRVRSPDEGAVLKQLLEHVEGARWKQRIRAKIAQSTR